MEKHIQTHTQYDWNSTDFLAVHSPLKTPAGRAEGAIAGLVILTLFLSLGVLGYCIFFADITLTDAQIKIWIGISVVGSIILGFAALLLLPERMQLFESSVVAKGILLNNNRVYFGEILLQLEPATGRIECVEEKTGVGEPIDEYRMLFEYSKLKEYWLMHRVSLRKGNTERFRINAPYSFYRPCAVEKNKGGDLLSTLGFMTHGLVQNEGLHFALLVRPFKTGPPVMYGALGSVFENIGDNIKVKNVERNLAKEFEDPANESIRSVRLLVEERGWNVFVGDPERK